MTVKANIGQLIVSIVARTAGFEEGTKKAAKSLGLLESQMKGTEKVVSGLTKAISAIGVAFSAGALVSKFNSTAQSLDLLAKQSQKIGILPEKLAALQFAGEQTGVSADTMANAMTKLQIRTSEAVIGAGEAVGVFKELGLRARDLQKLSPDKQFLRIASAMQGVEGQSDKMRIATKLFEEEGVALVNTLSLGEDGLRKMEDQARSLGLALSKEELAKVEAYNDAVNSLSKAIGGFSNKIVIDIAPAATKAIDDLTAAVGGFKLGSGGAKEGESWARRNFRWTLGAKDWINDTFIKPRTDARIAADIKRGVAAGSEAPDARALFGVRGLAVMRASQPGFNPADVQRAFDSANIIEKNQAKQIANSPVNKSLQAGSKALEDFVRNDLPDGWRKLGLFGKRAEVWLREQEGARLNPSDDVLRRRERMRQILEGRNTEESDPQFNSALIKGTVEAWQAVRANMLPKQQLDETKRQTQLLADIRDGVRRGGLQEVGI